MQIHGTFELPIMKTIPKKLLLILLGFIFITPLPLLQASPAIQHIPKNFLAQFTLYKRGFPVAETTYQFTRDKNSAAFKHVSLPSGLTSLFSNNKVEEKSTLNASENTLKAKTYQFTQTGDKNISIDSRFDWKKKTISTSHNQQPATEISFEHYIWDKSSTLLALISLAHNQRKSIFLHSFDGIKIKKYKLEYAGQREIELDDDEWIVSDIWKRKDGKKQVIFYLDPNSSYFPVKIEQYKNNKLDATLLLKELKWF